jgi:hypothetical protein
MGTHTPDPNTPTPTPTPTHSNLRLCVRPALREMPQLRAQFLQLFRVVGAVFGELLDGRLLGLVGLVAVRVGVKRYEWEGNMEK